MAKESSGCFHYIRIIHRINSISITDTNKEIKGNWNFAFSLKATESNEKVINKSVDQYGVKVSVEKIAISPMSFVVHYNQEVSDLIKNKWDEVYVELTIKDDLGNMYAGQGNGGKGFGSYLIIVSMRGILKP
ncbi:DUF5643 domain-containing protein [Peribacillus butanolivorans]|uniref:DUF5643 domain-containing protein n=1 Tax=Peribacillus butanolivorans TaxID=421767 RepID=UPI0035D9B955